MFGIGMMEIMIILVIALIFIGPDKMPEIARTLGKSFADFKRQADDVKDSFQVGMQKAAREEEKKNPEKEPLTAQGRAEKSLAESGVMPAEEMQQDATSSSSNVPQDDAWERVEDYDNPYEGTVERQPPEETTVEEDDPSSEKGEDSTVAQDEGSTQETTQTKV